MRVCMGVCMRDCACVYACVHACMCACILLLCVLNMLNLNYKGPARSSSAFFILCPVCDLLFVIYFFC